MKKIIIYCIFLIILIAPLSAGILQLNGSWQYQWGKSPVEEEWRGFSYPQVPPNRNGSDHLWMRTRLPFSAEEHDYIYLARVNYFFQCYIDGELIYSHGDVNNDGESRITEMPNFFIPIPEGSGGAELVFHVYSPYSVIGIDGSVFLGEAVELYELMLGDNLSVVIIASICLFIGLFAFGIYIFNYTDMQYFSLGIFCLITGLYLMSISELRTFLFDYPVFWVYTDLFSLSLLPVVLAWFFDATFGPGKNEMIRVFWRTQIGVFVYVLIVHCIGFQYMFESLPFILFSMLATALFILSRTIVLASKEHTDARIFLLGITILLLFSVNDILVGMGAVYWWTTLGHYGVMGFVLCMLAVIARRLIKTRKLLVRYSDRLKTEVDNRTKDLNNAMRQLAEANDRLYELSFKDGLTGVYNRRYFDELYKKEWARMKREKSDLSVIMIDIDYFKKYNDLYGHKNGDLCLQNVAAVLEQSVRRPADCVARYGGEEFIVLLPYTDVYGAYQIAEEMRKNIESLKIRHAEFASKQVVTVSLGISSTSQSKLQNKDVLLEDADRALYISKANGRNVVTLANQHFSS